MARDAALLQRLPPPPKEAREAVQAVRAELSKAFALEATAAYEDGIVEARRALAHAEAMQWPPLRAAAELRLGALVERSGDYEAAEKQLEKAYFEAAKIGALEEAFSAAHRLVFAVGYRLRRFEDAERWSRHCDVIRAALPDPAGLREASSLNHLAILRYAAGRFADAAKLHERALAIREKALGSDHPDVAESLNNLAGVHCTMEEYAEAKRLHERALAIREATLGRDHPHVATSLDNLGNVESAWGRHAEAAALHEGELAIKEKALGPDHPEVAITLVNLAAVRQVTGRFDDAIELCERALAIDEKALGPDHPDVAMVLNNLATVSYSMGRRAEAAGLHERALAIREKALGTDHPDVAQSLNNLAGARYVMGDMAEAGRLYERALVVFETRFGSGHPTLIHPLVGLGRVALAQQRSSDAVAVLERAVELAEASDVSEVDAGVARLLLGQAFVGAGEANDRAIGLVARARDAFRQAGQAQLLADAEAFFASTHCGRVRSSPVDTRMRISLSTACFVIGCVASPGGAASFGSGISTGDGASSTDATNDTTSAHGSSSSAGVESSDGDAPNLDVVPPDTDGNAGEIAEVFGHSGDTLYRMNADTKAVTNVGTFTGVLSGSIIDIALDADSRMYGAAFGALYSIDKQTAACTLIAEGSYPTSLSFVPAGTVDPDEEALVGYVEAEYIRIDVDTGAVTTIGTLSDGLESSGDVVSVKDGGTYLTVKGPPCTDGDCLVEIDPATGELVQNFGELPWADVFGLGFWGGTAYGFARDGTLFSVEFMPDGSLSTTSIPVPGGAAVEWFGAGSTTSAPPAAG